MNTTVKLNIKKTVEDLNSLLHAGQMCSNVCFNLKQQNLLDDKTKQACTGAYVEWDKTAPLIYKLKRKLEKQLKNKSKTL